MKTFEQICDEVAKDCFYEKWIFMPWSTQAGLFKQVSIMYAKEVAQHHADNIYSKINPRFESGVDEIGFVYMDGLKELINETPVELP